MFVSYIRVYVSSDITVRYSRPQSQVSEVTLGKESLQWLVFVFNKTVSMIFTATMRSIQILQGPAGFGFVNLSHYPTMTLR
jgi:hypothetical protein